MKPIFKITFLFFVVSCIGEKKSRFDINSYALKTANNFTEEKLQIFRTWTYAERGKNCEIWSKVTDDSSYYNCIHNKIDDTVYLSVYKIANFLKEFPSDSNLFNLKSGITLIKLSNTELRVETNLDQGQDSIVYSKIKIKELFKTKSPFQEFEKLSKIKDSLNIIQSTYYKNSGNFITFHITYEHTLTYIPKEFKALNFKSKEYWINHLKNGVKINENWILHKLNQPLDNT